MTEEAFWNVFRVPDLRAQIYMQNYTCLYQFWVSERMHLVPAKFVPRYQADAKYLAQTGDSTFLKWLRGWPEYLRRIHDIIGYVYAFTYDPTCFGFEHAIDQYSKAPCRAGPDFGEWTSETMRFVIRANHIGVLTEIYINNHNVGVIDILEMAAEERRIDIFKYFYKNFGGQPCDLYGIVFIKNIDPVVYVWANDAKAFTEAERAKLFQFSLLTGRDDIHQYIYPGPDSIGAYFAQASEGHAERTTKIAIDNSFASIIEKRLIRAPEKTWKYARRALKGGSPAMTIKILYFGLKTLYWAT